MNKKRLLSLICVVVMILTAVQIPSYAAEIVGIDLGKGVATIYTEAGTKYPKDGSNNGPADGPLAGNEYIEGDLTVHALYDDDTVSNITNNSRVTYTSSNTSVVEFVSGGHYLVKAPGMAVVTVEYEGFEKSVAVYSVGEQVIIRRDRQAPSGTSTVQSATEPLYGDTVMWLNQNSSNSHQISQVTSESSYVTGAWIYDDGSNKPYFGFGPSTSKYVYFGVTRKSNATADELKTYQATASGFGNSAPTIECTPIQRQKGWHQVFAVANYDSSTGKTKVFIYFDGKEAAYTELSGTHVPKYLYTGHRLFFRERFVAPLVTQTVAYVESNILDGAEVDKDVEFEYEFTGEISSNSFIAPVLSDADEGTELETTVEIKGNKISVKPKYDLVPGRSYSLDYTGSIVKSATSAFTDEVAIAFPPATELPVTFTVKQADLYAETPALDASGEEASFAADIINNGEETAYPYMIVAQYGEDGVVAAISAEEETVDAETADNYVIDAQKASLATRFEGYVVSSINEEEVTALKIASDGADTREVILAESETGTYADLSYNTETDMVEVHIATKTKYAGLPVVIRVMNRDKDFADATASNFDEVYNRFEVLETDADGRIDYAFKLAGEGKFDAIVNIPFDSAIHDSVSVVTYDKIMEEIANIQSADPAVAEEVFEAARDFIDIDYSDFDNLVHKEIIYAMLKSASECGSPEEYATLFYECVAIVKALENNDTQAVIDNRYLWEIASSSVYADYIEIEDTTEINQAILERKFATYTDFSEAFAEETFIYLVRNISESIEIYELLKAKDDIAEIDFTDYEDLSFLRRESVDEIVYEQIFAEPSDINSVADLVDAFDAAVVFVIENSVTDATVIGIDISQNKTMFSDVAYKTGPLDEKEGTLKVYAEYNNGDVENISGDGEITYESSDETIVEIDNDGNYEVVGNGAAVVTVKYGEFEKSAVFYCTPTAPYDRRYVAPTATSSIKEADDPFYRGEKAMKLDSNSSEYHQVGPASWQSYAAGAWVYDNGEDNDTFFGVGSGTAYVYYGARSSHSEYKIRSTGISIAEETKTLERKKGWHQIYIVASYDALSQRTNLKFFFDGQYAGKTSFAGTKGPESLFTGDKALFKERYVANYYTPYEFGLVGNNVADINKDEDIEFTFNGKIGTANNVIVSLTDILNNQEIEATTSVEEDTIVVSPTYPLMANTEYSIDISARLSDEGSDFTLPQSISLSYGGSFTTNADALYAHNTTITSMGADGFSFGAQFVNEEQSDPTGFMIVSQYDDNGLPTSITAKKVAKTATSSSLTGTVLEGTTAIEGYVWSDISKENIFSLAAATDYLEDYQRNTTDSYNGSGSYVRASYFPDREEVVLQVASKTKRKGIPVLVRVVEKGKNIANATESNIDEIYNRVEQLVTGENGKLEYAFEISGDPGEYQIIVNILFDEPLKDSIIYTTSDVANAKIQAIQDATADTAAAVFDDARTSLDLDYSDFDDLTNKAIVYAMLAEAEDCENFTEFAALFYECIDVVKALEENDLEKIEEYSDECGVSSYSVYTLYKNLSTAARKKVNNAILKKGFADYQELGEAFKEQMVLYKVKSVLSYSEIYSLLVSMNDVISMDYTEYNDLSSQERTEAMKALSNRLSNINSIQDLKDEFDDAVSDADGGSGGGGGGGGGSITGDLTGGSGDKMTTEITGQYEIPSESAMGAQTPAWAEYEKMLRERKVFDDIESVPWAEDSIRELYNMGVISGKAEGIFAPNDYVTREEICKMLVLAVGLTPSEIVETTSFSDVNPSAWYAPFIDAAFKNGVVNGKSDTVFGTGNYVTREELCALADRAAVAVGVFLDDEFTIKAFVDEHLISSWALNSVRKMRESFIVSGMGGNRFNPSVNVTRAQAAKIIYGVVQYSAE